MVSRFRRNWRWLMCLCGFCFGLSLLYLKPHQAVGQIAPAVTGSSDPIQFGQSNYTVSQGQTANIVVTLSNPAQSTVTVQYATSDGTGKAGVDYTATSGTLTFSPGGALYQSFTISTMVDPNGQSSVTVNLTLSSPSGATLGTPSTATLYLVNDQQACQNDPNG